MKKIEIEVYTVEEKKPNSKYYVLLICDGETVEQTEHIGYYKDNAFINREFDEPFLPGEVSHWCELPNITEVK